MKVGRGTEDGVKVGPLIDATPARQGRRARRRRDRQGRRACCSAAARATARGYFYAPTVLAGVPDDARLLDEEIFGPVAPVIALRRRGARSPPPTTPSTASSPTSTRATSSAPSASARRSRPAWSASTRASSPTPRRRSAASSSPASAARAAPRASTSTSRQVRRDGDVSDPLEQFRAWYEHAVAAGLPEPEAMALATATPDGRAVGALRAAQGRRRARRRVLHQLREPQGARAGRQPARRARRSTGSRSQRQVRLEGPVERARPPRSPTRTSRRARAARSSAPGRRDRAGRSRTASGSRRACARSRADTRTTVPRPPHWGGYRLRARRDRVLGGPAEPPARPRGVHAGLRRRLARAAAL